MKRRERRPIRRRIPRFVAFRLRRPIAVHMLVHAARAAPNDRTAIDEDADRPAAVVRALVLCWPLALLALVRWPLAWLIALPFRLVGITFTALFAFLGALLMLPARLLRGPAPHVAA